MVSVTCQVWLKNCKRDPNSLQRRCRGDTNVHQRDISWSFQQVLAYINMLKYTVQHALWRTCSCIFFLRMDPKLNKRKLSLYTVNSLKCQKTIKLNLNSQIRTLWNTWSHQIWFRRGGRFFTCNRLLIFKASSTEVTLN